MQRLYTNRTFSVPNCNHIHTHMTRAALFTPNHLFPAEIRLNIYLYKPTVFKKKTATAFKNACVKHNCARTLTQHTTRVWQRGNRHQEDERSSIYGQPHHRLLIYRFLHTQLRALSHHLSSTRAAAPLPRRSATTTTTTNVRLNFRHNRAFDRLPSVQAVVT